MGSEHLDDDGIVILVAGSSNYEVDSDDESDDGDASEISATEPAIGHKDAMVKCDECLTWLWCQPEATPYNVSVLVSLKEIAANKRFAAMKQLTLTSYFTTEK